MRQKEIIGAFVQVPIDETYHTYGRIVNKLVYVFYDLKTDLETVDLDSIEKADILFKLIIKKSPVTNGHWKIVGVKELYQELTEAVPFFKQEIGRPNDCSIIFIEGERTLKVSPDDCVGLERLAVWDYEHVEQRLRDYYNGVQNQDAYVLRVNGIK